MAHRIVVNLLLYADDIVLLARFPSDLDKQLRLLKDFCSTMGMTINIDKTKVMIIKSKKDTYTNFVYDNNNLEEVYSYKYLGIDIHHKLNWNHSIEKRINGGWKAYFGLENNCKTTNIVMWDKKKLLFGTLVTPEHKWECRGEGLLSIVYIDIKFSLPYLTKPSSRSLGISSSNVHVGRLSWHLVALSLNQV